MELVSCPTAIDRPGTELPTRNVMQHSIMLEVSLTPCKEALAALTVHPLFITCSAHGVTLDHQDLRDLFWTPHAG